MSRELTNKLLILNSILLAIILSLLLILNFDVLVEKFGYKPTEVAKTDIEYYGQKWYYPVQDSLKACFDRLRLDTTELPDEITEIVAAKLKGFNWNNEFQEEDLHSIEHNRIFAQEFPPDRGPLRKWVILTFSNFDSNFYHAARGRVSLFEFQMENQHWRMTRNFIAFGDGDEEGFEPIGCELVRIGRNNKYAAIIHTSYSGQGGHLMEFKSVYLEVDGVFKSAIDFTIFEYNNYLVPFINYSERYLEIQIIESDKAYFDIATKSEDADWEDKTFGVVKHFVFTGEFYEENPCWLYTDNPIYTNGE